MRIQLSELSKIPYLEVEDLGEREIPLQPLWDGTRWRQWMPDGHGLVVELENPGFLQGRYFSKEPANKDTDGLFVFLELITKRASFPNIMSFAVAIENDLYNLGAVLWKLDHFFDHTSGTASTYLALTELEYVFVVCRSLIDLLQEIVARLWQRVLLNGRPPPKQLPSTYRKMLLHGDRILTSDEIANIWGVPASMADFYAGSGAFFLALRQARDRILHRGETHNLIFRMETGFAVMSTAEPFASLTTWPDSAITGNDLGSLRYLLARLLTQTLQICERFAATFAASIELPADIAPKYRVFVRGFHISTLRRLEQVCKTPWERFIDPGDLEIDT